MQVSPILTGLSDRHPYVRRTAVMGVLKVYHIDPNTVAQQGAKDAHDTPVACFSWHGCVRLRPGSRRPYEHV
jgi:hypothetical protein